MFYISGLYKFKKILNIKKNKKKLQVFFIKNNIRGTVIISKEGINGTISSNRRNLNLYVISQNSDGTLQSLNTVAKQNIKTWISTRKMAADTIDILDAKIVNLGMNFTIISDGLVDKQSVFSNCIEKINEELRNPFFIGENFPISRFYGILNRVRGVSDVKNVVITKQSGDGYSGFQFDIESNISDDGRFLEAPRNVIFEIKFDSDIQGSII